MNFDPFNSAVLRVREIRTLRAAAMISRCEQNHEVARLLAAMIQDREERIARIADLIIAENKQ